MSAISIETVALCSTDDVWDGGALRVHARGFPPLAVFNLEGEFFVMDDRCTHGDASLSEGYVENGEIECPYHQGRFCIRTGEPRAEPCEVAMKVYPVQVLGGRVCIAKDPA
jgi:ethylbenzene dioxygenase ferredoxin subunit